MTKLTVAFRNFANAHTNDMFQKSAKENVLTTPSPFYYLHFVTALRVDFNCILLFVLLLPVVIVLSSIAALTEKGTNFEFCHYCIQ